MIRWAAVVLVGCGATSQITDTSVGRAAVTSSSTSPATIPPLTELCINELVADGQGAWLNDAGLPSDWVELHNPTGQDVSLAGYFLSDSADAPFAAALPNLVLKAGGFTVFAADGGAEPGPYHLPFALNSGGETVALTRFDGAGQVLNFGAMGTDVAWARVPDCCPDPSVCAVEVVGGSPGESNE